MGRSSRENTVNRRRVWRGSCCGASFITCRRPARPTLTRWRVTASADRSRGRGMRSDWRRGKKGRTGFLDRRVHGAAEEGGMDASPGEARGGVLPDALKATFLCTGKPARRFLTASSWTRTGPSTTETGCGCRARASSISISACTGRCRSVRSTIKTVTSSDITFHSCATCGKVHLRAVARAAGRAEESRVRRWGGLPRAHRGPCGGVQRVHR